MEQSKTEIETAIFSEQLQRPEVTKELIIFFIGRQRKIDVNDLESRKRLINTFVNSIYLYDDKIVFIINYKDGTKEVTLQEIEELLDSDLEASTPLQQNDRLSAREILIGLRAKMGAHRGARESHLR